MEPEDPLTSFSLILLRKVDRKTERGSDGWVLCNKQRGCSAKYI